MRTFLAVLLSTFMAVSAFAASEKIVSFSGHRLKVTVPAGYSFKLDKDEMGNARVIMENPVWEISILALLNPESDPKSSTPEWQEEQVVTIMAQALSQSKEKDYKFQRLRPKAGTGTFCVFTDETLKKGDVRKPNDYVHMVGGVKVNRGCLVAFQIMTNDLTSPEYQEAFALFTDSFSE